MTGILAGALPALRAGQTNLTDALNDGGRHDGTLGIHMRRAFVVGEVALSLVLLMGAGVTLRSLAALRSVEPGFNAQNVLTMRVSLPESRYPTAAQTAAFFDTALERLRALPGVQATGTIDDLPTTGGSVQPIVLEGRPELLPNAQPTVQVRRISPGYLRAMNIPVLQGRDLAERDSDVMLVSRGAARLLWGGEDPIGTRTSLPLVSRTVFNEVIGIVGDIKDDLDEAAEPSVYVYSRTDSIARRAFAIRTSVPPLSIAQSAAGVVRALDADQPVEDIRSMDTVVEQALSAPRFNATLLGLFAAVALALASIGIYSLLAYIVRGRSREIGIRSALGAQKTDVVRLVVLEGMTPALVGIGVGVVVALAASRMLESLVFNVSAADPLTLAVVAATLALVALLASIVPAYRAARLDPATVLRLN